ncbi:MAG: hypothetical protein WCG82_11800, partial [Bacteroidota bacterium]
IERYINGKLTNDDVYNFETRLYEDREFARKYRTRKTFPEMMKAARDVSSEFILAETPDPEIEWRYSDLKKPKYLVWGAIAAIMIGVVIFFIVQKINQPIEGSTTLSNSSVNDSLTKPTLKQSDIITERQAIDITMRKPVELNSPDDGVTFSRKDEIVFNWELETDTFNYLYIFSEINNKLVWWRGIKPGIRENKVAAINFLPGRFYWYVGNKDVKRTFIIEE